MPEHLSVLRPGAFCLVVVWSQYAVNVACLFPTSRGYGRGNAMDGGSKEPYGRRRSQLMMPILHGDCAR